MSYTLFRPLTLQESLTRYPQQPPPPFEQWGAYHAGFIQGQRAFAEDPIVTKSKALAAKIIHEEGKRFDIPAQERAFCLGYSYGVLTADRAVVGGGR